MYKKLMAELLGAMAFTLFGCGVIVLSQGSLGTAAIASVFGLTICLATFVAGDHADCHYNPVVTIAMLVAGRISLIEAEKYIVLQLIGAFLGIGIVYAIAIGAPGYDIATQGLGQNGYGTASPANYSMVSCFVAELCVSFFYIQVVLSIRAVTVNLLFDAVCSGAAIVVAYLLLIPVTGGSINPARSIAPGVLVGGLAARQLWLFIVAPTLGGALSGLLWRQLSNKN